MVVYTLERIKTMGVAGESAKCCWGLPLGARDGTESGWCGFAMRSL